MISQIFAIASRISLLLCVTTAIVLSRSAVKPIGIAWCNAQSTTGYLIWCNKGRLEFQKSWSARPVTLNSGEVGRGIDTVGWSFPGFLFYRGMFIKQNSGGAIMPGVYGRWKAFSLASAWPLAISLPLSVLALFRVIPRWTRRSRRRQLGLCHSCGYDLRASNDLCPECGTRLTSNAERGFA